MSNENLIIKRERPVICVSCPICNSVFHAAVFNAEHLIHIKEDGGLLQELVGYAELGMNISFREAKDVQLNFCTHIKNSI